MRQIYSSPRPTNVEHVHALMNEHGIKASIQNRSNWNRPGHRRFSYQEPETERDHWEQVWIERADDYPRARALLRELGLEPEVRYGAELAAARNTTPQARRRNTAARARRFAMVAVLAVAAMAVLRYLRVF